jgi:hypothetical protein
MFIDNPTRMLSNILHMYTTYYAMPETKDHIYGVVHPALSALNWKDFLPCLKDIEAMTKIIGKFLPQSHAFLGAIFIQVFIYLFLYIHILL